MFWFQLLAISLYSLTFVFGSIFISEKPIVLVVLQPKQKQETKCAWNKELCEMMNRRSRLTP